MSVENDLKILDDLNNTLDKMIEFTTKSFSTLEDLEGKAQDKIQEEVDKICEKVSKKGSEKLDSIRDKTVDTLHKKYVSANAIVTKLEPIINAKITNLGEVISLLGKMVALYAKPYQDALDYTIGFIATATPKIADIAEKSLKLYNLKDEIPLPTGLNVNLDKLKVSMKPITINDIISG